MCSIYFRPCTPLTPMLISGRYFCIKCTPLAIHPAPMQQQFRRQPIQLNTPSQLGRVACINLFVGMTVYSMLFQYKQYYYIGYEDHCSLTQKKKSCNCRLFLYNDQQCQQVTIIIIIIGTITSYHTHNQKLSLFLMSSIRSTTMTVLLQS